VGFKLIAVGILGQILKTKIVKDRKPSTVMKFRQAVGKTYGQDPMVHVEALTEKGE